MQLTFQFDFDQRALVDELARIRGLINAIPLHLNTYFPTLTASHALFDLEDRLRWLPEAAESRQTSIQASLSGPYGPDSH